MLIVQKVMYMFNIIPIKITLTFLKNYKNYLKICLEAQKSMGIQINPNRMNTAEG